MDVLNALHMIGGRGATSYSANSQLQEKVISIAKRFVEKSIVDLYCETSPKCLTIADLGCSSGPNTLLVIREIIDIINLTCQKSNHKSPEFQVILNDLPGNDFNNIFVSIPSFLEKLRKDKGGGFGPCFISGLPGSFHGRLFPSKTLNFVHSSYSLHFLSQVPPGIANKGNIYVATSSHPSVFEAYLMQFQKDLKAFLSSRSAEMLQNGRMVITMLGRRNSKHLTDECCHFWELLALSLRDMVSQGLVEEEKLDSFNLPWYAPSATEVTDIMQQEASFLLDIMEIFEVSWDPNEDHHIKNPTSSGQNVANCIRAVTESMIISHFGEEIIEDLFKSYACHVAEYLTHGQGKYVNLVMCMTKK